MHLSAINIGMTPTAFCGIILLMLIIPPSRTLQSRCLTQASSFTILGVGASNVLQCQREASASADRPAERGESLTPIIWRVTPDVLRQLRKVAIFPQIAPRLLLFITGLRPAPGPAEQGGRRGGEGVAGNRGRNNDTTSAAWKLPEEMQLKSLKRKRGDSHWIRN